MTVHDSNIDRLLAAFAHEKLDRVPNFEILIDPRSVSHLLGRRTNETLWTLPPAEARRVAEAVGQDAIACSLTWMHTPEGSVLTDADADRISPPDPAEARAKVEAYLDALDGGGVGLCARLSSPLTLTYMTTGPVPIESFMMLLYDNRPLVERLMDLYLEYHLRVIEAVKDLPYHFYYIGDDLSSSTGPLISPTMLAELWAPRAERLVKAALATDRPVLFHCCGAQAPILPYLVDWGVQAAHPVQPAANDIYQVHAAYGDKLTLVGNIDVAGALSFGTAEAVRAETREHIDRLAGDGGYVVGSSHSIIDSVIPENYLAMVEATHEYGRYA
ncbi:MAG: uroporphyrinogen decarboxylase family protein [Planctomycetota bacterium]